MKSQPMRRIRRESTPIFGGIQHRYTFANGWGASVIRHSGSYGHEHGLWEIAVLNRGQLDFTNPVIPGDVLGWRTDAEIVVLLVRIARLPARAHGGA